MSQGPAESADLGALAELAPELASTFVSVASDIALVIGADGVIRNVAQGDAPLLRRAAGWVGQTFASTVTEDSRGKIQQLLKDVDTCGVSRRREVNLVGGDGADIPVAFAAIRLGRDGPVLAVGRDLRAIAAIQQRFVEAQQELERDYWRQRQAESRYRLLFQVATDAVLVVDAASMAIVEANRAAAALFGRSVQALVGQAVSAGVDAMSRPAVDELLLTARSSGKPAEIRARLQGAVPGEAPSLVDISATPFRAVTDNLPQMLLLVRARRSEARGERSSGSGQQRLADYVEHTPDAVAITDSSGRVLMANPALLKLCPAGSTEPQLKGRPLALVLGDRSLKLDALVAETRRTGIVALASLPLGGMGGADGPPPVVVEVSAALMEEGDQECLGFTLRRLPPVRSVASLPTLGGLAEAIEALAGNLGSATLPNLLEEATLLAEKHLIRSALGRTQGDLTAAAKWLGITPDDLALRLQHQALSAGPVSIGPSTLLN